MSEHIYILEENSLHAIFKLRYIYSFMLSLKVRFIPYSSYIQRTKRSNYASSSRLQEYENSGNSETVKQKVVAVALERWSNMEGRLQKHELYTKGGSKNQNWIAGP